MSDHDEIYTSATKVHASASQEIRVLNGGQGVVVQKLYGPASCEDVRVHLDIVRGEWVVERSRTSTPFDGSSTWVEVARFDADPEVVDGGP